MTLLKYSPCEQFDNILSLLDHPMMQGQRIKCKSPNVLSTPADIIEKDDAYLLRMDLPGFLKENIDISYHENRLTIKGHRETISEDTENQFKSIERSNGSICRNFSFPDVVNSEKMTAKYDNGVLEVRLPKQPVVKPQRVVID